MYKLGLIGYPLSHSISGVIQRAGLKSLGLEGSYDTLETPPEDLIQRIKFLKANDYTGFNITIPLKVPISLFLEEIDEYANLAGCANTVKIMPDKSFYGFNTDVYGFKKAIPVDVQQNLRGKTVSILGAGGASRAVTVALVELGVKEIEFYVRNIINSGEMVNSLRTSFPSTIFKVYQINNIRDLAHTSMLVNTTPIGMRGHSADLMPIEPMSVRGLNKDCVVYDIIYNPIKTLLVKEAEKNGLKAISGLDMLIYQGAKALEIWTGKTPDISAMKIAALENL